MSKSKRCRCVLQNPGRVSTATSAWNSPCVDVCASPICAEPTILTLMAPVIYDQLGINLCSSVTIPGLDGFSTATSASVQVISIDLGEGSEITQVPGRSNCYRITLAGLTATFAVHLYDCANRLLTTLTASAVYLPDEDADNFDEETNPSSIEFDLFAPYGVSYSDGDLTTPVLNYLGFSTANGAILQGLNYTAFAKLLNLDIEDSTATIGLTLYVLSLYYAQYGFTGATRSEVPKVSLIPDEDSLCQDFVDGDLLNLSIKPLELSFPQCEANIKRPCPTCDSCCSTLTQAPEGAEPLPLEDDNEG